MTIRTLIECDALLCCTDVYIDDDLTILDETLKRIGWHKSTTVSDTHFCPECWNKIEDH